MRKAIFLSALLCAACSNYPASLPSIKPYKMDIQQGNVVTPKMMMQLRPGMTKAQVKFIMGTPLIADSFHANRWDYFYQMRKDGKIFEQRRVILDFEDEKLSHVRGDVVPAGSDSTGSSSDAPANKAPVTLKSTSDPAPKEKGLIDKLKFWKSGEPEQAPQPEVKPAPVPVPVPVEPMQPVIEEKPEALPPLMDPAVSGAEASSPAPAAKPEPGPVTQPEPQAASQAAPEQKKEEKSLLDKLKFWKSDEPKSAPAQQVNPAPKADPAQNANKVEQKPAPQPETKPDPKPEAKPAAKVESKPVPKPKDDMPAEDDPSYFERMLEKIGF